MLVLDWVGWDWSGWNALVAFGTIALAGVTTWVSLRERRRTADQRWYEQLVAAAANVRAVAAAVPMMRAGLILEAKPPPTVATLSFRLSGRPWPIDSASVMTLSALLTAATSSLALVELRLTKEGRAAASEYWAARDGLLAEPGDEEHARRLTDAAVDVARAIEAQARRLM